MNKTQISSSVTRAEFQEINGHTWPVAEVASGCRGQRLPWQKLREKTFPPSQKVLGASPWQRPHLGLLQAESEPRLWVQAVHTCPVSPSRQEGRRTIWPTSESTSGLGQPPQSCRPQARPPLYQVTLTRSHCPPQSDGQRGGRVSQTD